jgi:hypothetical protein
MRVEFEHFRVFGWLTVRCSAPTGTVYYYEVPTKILGDEKPTATFYTRGKIEVRLDENIPCDDRVPGFFSGDLPGYEAGTLKMTVIEDAEWWCLDSMVIKAALPQVSFIHLSVNEVRTLPIGSKIFLAAGTVEISHTTYHGPCAIEVASKPAELRAVTSVYGLSF